MAMGGASAAVQNITNTGVLAGGTVDTDCGSLGISWLRLDVPGTYGFVYAYQLTSVPEACYNATVSYDVYNPSDVLVASGTDTIDADPVTDLVLSPPLDPNQIDRIEVWIAS